MRNRKKAKRIGSLVADMTLAAIAPLILVAMLYLAPAASISSGEKFITGPVVRGDLSVRVQATGTVEPTRLLEVSTELSGTIKNVLVKPNDVVKAGQILAELDPATAKAQLARARAIAAASEARLKEAQASVRQSGADLDRKNRLRDNRFTSQREIDSAQYASERSMASVETIKAEIDAAKAEVRMAEALLAKTRILSPIDAVILRRNAEPGQTIVSAMQPPVLFRLAENLDQMQIRVDVDEADAINVVAGQPAKFTVQALPHRAFEARVESIHVGPEVIQGVVTYKAVLSFDNRQLRLKPGMTATADITVESVRDKLLVPNSALRFAPADSEIEGPISPPNIVSRLFGVTHASGAVIEAIPVLPPEPLDVPGIERVVFVLNGGSLRKIRVNTTFSDGNFTVIKDGPLRAGQRVVIDHRDRTE